MTNEGARVSEGAHDIWDEKRKLNDHRMCAIVKRAYYVWEKSDKHSTASVLLYGYGT